DAAAGFGEEGGAGEDPCPLVIEVGPPCRGGGERGWAGTNPERVGVGNASRSFVSRGSPDGRLDGRGALGWAGGRRRPPRHGAASLRRRRAGLDGRRPPVRGWPRL